MKKLVSEDITDEKLSWIIECVDEMFSDLDENENDTNRPYQKIRHLPSCQPLVVNLKLHATPYHIPNLFCKFF